VLASRLLRSGLADLFDASAPFSSRLPGVASGDGAEPGQIVIGEATHAAIKDAAVVERLGPIEVKGKERPVQAYALTDFRG
jgi:class 3 adenylate cyclase